ncbi:MAG: HD-GYP domain-containing protein [Candidatus Sericytochromatia bacterium]|uniref:HD-GYP domain-containing protein n=1 Tax=Candidatus Tanganyikabacteria bacterium TaxID=2961651 RepID=A0A937X401_9BACT|nr:HD-GYP domain-containing protein [Candidatus Tanganyikabacteria bacterium]
MARSNAFSFRRQPAYRPDRDTPHVAAQPRREYDDPAVQVLIRALEMRDPFTLGHAERVADLSVAVAKRLRWDESKVADLRLAALLHDLGNLGVEDQILNKVGRLTPEEVAKMQAHTRLGATLVEGAPALDVAGPVILFHHERWDGAGYPKRLLGADIPIEARIVAITDAYDAMISNRSYRRSMTSDEASRELKRQSGYQFDPSLLGIFLDVSNSGSGN